METGWWTEGGDKEDEAISWVFGSGMIITIVLREFDDYKKF